MIELRKKNGRERQNDIKKDEKIARCPKRIN